MTVFEKIRELLDENNTKYEVIEHEPVYTSEDAARIRDTSTSIGAKALVWFADKNPVLIVVPGDSRLDVKKFKVAFGVKDLKFANPQEVEKLTGVAIGAVPPVGKAISLPSYFDKSFEKMTNVAFNAGLHTHSIKMQASDLILIESPKIADLI